MPSRTHPSATTRVPSPGQHGHRERALTQSQPARVGQTADALVLKDGDHLLLCTDGDVPVRIVAGLRAYGRDAEALTLASALFDAASGFRDYRLPELFCGYERDPGGEPPVRYPVACTPQAWAAGAMPDVITSLLGLRADAAARTVHVDPVLPPWIDWIELKGLRLGTGSVDLRVERRTDGTIRHHSRSTRIAVVRATGGRRGAR